MAYRLLITAAALITAAGMLNAQESPAEAYDSIDPLEVYSFCDELASEKYAGRLTGHEGYTAAASWAAGRFEEWGLRPVAGSEDFLLPFPCPYSIVHGSSMTLIGPGDSAYALEVLEDFMPMLFTDGGEAEAGIVFAGWGIHAPGLGYDDYEGIDVTGRFVICFRGTPDSSEEGYKEHDTHRKRMLTAKEMGAAGLFYIYEKPMANPNGDLLEDFFCGMISSSRADSILVSSGMNSEGLRNALLEDRHPHSFETGWKALFSAEVEHFRDGTGYNAAAVLEGSDPDLKSDCIVLGAHLDHCGRHMGMTFAGAQDNASGSAVVMEIARAFSLLEKRPARSVIFVLFGAEEMGLIGSTTFAGFVSENYAGIEAMLNFDMVGEGDGVSAGVTAGPGGLEETLAEADRTVNALGRTWEIREVGVRSSDYAPFFLKGACCAAFFSNGPHMHYHRPGDTIYRINPHMLADTARLGFLTAYSRASR